MVIQYFICNILSDIMPRDKISLSTDVKKTVKKMCQGIWEKKAQRVKMYGKLRKQTYVRSLKLLFIHLEST